MTDSDKQPNQLTLLDSLSKYVAVGVGVLYFIGFLVVARHLSRYGVSSFSVLHLQYLIAGAWVVGPPIVFALLAHTAHEFEERAAPKTPGRFNWRRVLISSSITGIPFFLCYGSLASLISENITWGLGIKLFLFYIAMVASGQVFLISWQTQSEKETWSLNRRHAAPFYLTLSLSILLAYVLWFAVRIYPLIPFSLGGGQPLTVAFIEGEKKLPDGIKADVSSKRSVPYKLLAATDKYYVVVSQDRNEKSIEVSRDSVAGIVVLEEPHAP